MDDLTPPHWGTEEMPHQMTDEYISAMTERLETYEDVPVSEIAAALTALRAQLAEARAERDVWEIDAKRNHQAAEIEFARADRAEAALAAQIEADAGVAVKETAMSPQFNVKDQWRASIGEEVASAIRTQPHDRTALDRMLRAEREKALRAAADAFMDRSAPRMTILAMIPKGAADDRA